MFFYFSKFKDGYDSLFVPFKYGEEELEQLVSSEGWGKNPSIRFLYIGNEYPESSNARSAMYLSLYKNDWVLYNQNERTGLGNYGYHFSPNFKSIRDILNDFDFSVLTDDYYLNNSLWVELYDLEPEGLYTVVIATENDLYFYLINRSGVLNKYVVKDAYRSKLIDNNYNPKEGRLSFSARPRSTNSFYDKKCDEWDFEITDLNTNDPKHKFTCTKYKKSINYVLLNSKDLRPLVVKDLEVDSVLISTYYKTYGDYRFLYSLDDNSRSFDIKVPVYEESSNKFVDYKEYSLDQFVSLVKEYTNDYTPGFESLTVRYYNTDLGNAQYYKLEYRDNTLMLEPTEEANNAKYSFPINSGLKGVLDEYESMRMFGPSDLSMSNSLYGGRSFGGGPRPDFTPDFIVYRGPENLVIYTVGYVGFGSSLFEYDQREPYGFRTLLRKYTFTIQGELVSDSGYIDLSEAGLGYMLGVVGYRFEKPLDNSGDTIIWLTNGVYEFGGPQNFAKIKLNNGTAELIDTYKFSVGRNAYDANESTWGYNPIGYFFGLIGDKIYYSSKFRNIITMSDIVMKGHDDISVLNITDGSTNLLLTFPAEYKYVSSLIDSEQYLYFKAFYSVPENYYSEDPDICLVYNTESNQLAEYAVSPPSSTNSDPYCSVPGYD